MTKLKHVFGDCRGGYIVAVKFAPRGWYALYQTQFSGYSSTGVGATWQEAVWSVWHAPGTVLVNLPQARIIALALGDDNPFRRTDHG